MRKLITAGLAALLLSLALPSHADALGGRRGKGGRSAKARATWGQPSAAKSKKSGSTAKKRARTTGLLPSVNVPQGAGLGGAAAGGRRRAVPSASIAKRSPIKVDVNAGISQKSTPVLVNGGLSGSGSGGSAHKKRGKKGKKG
ncbi:MAG: hypothetical protein ABI877_20205 [Gemmatimonadaceae bacterium]